MENKGFVLLFLLLINFAGSGSDSFEASNLHNELPNACPSEIKGRVPWILSKREDYGWGEHTHRAVIALAVNKYPGSEEAEWRRMDLQLDKEITQALLRNNDTHDNDLALFIHALVARSKNPRNFYGEDLVADLLQRIERTRGQVHPFLILALCNSHAVTYDHLKRLKSLTENMSSKECRQQIEMTSLSLKAFACAADLDRNLNKFKQNMKHAVDCLREMQADDGSFGNAYTTALAVQALTAYDAKEAWNEVKALDYLKKEADINVNMIKAYYIEMALNARQVKFIKDLSTKIPQPVPGRGDTDEHYLWYTVKTDIQPDVYVTITIKVPTSNNFYEIMEKCVEESKHFRFASYENEEGDPVVFSVAGMPNDAEEDLYWRLCVKQNIEHLNHTFETEEIFKSPKRFIPEKNSDITFWYRNSRCP